MDRPAIEQIELTLLLEAVMQRYGYDFRNYAKASLNRSITGFIQKEKLAGISELQQKILYYPHYMERLLKEVSINVTEFFRDPNFFKSFRLKVVPLLRTYPFVRVWNAGCSTGEEVYSLAIVLFEEGLLDKTKIYATDFNDAVLKKAQSGIFPLKSMRESTRNYIQAGGKESFSEYYLVREKDAIFTSRLKNNIVFACHDLTRDGSFNEFNVIMCRNVMIYFNKKLRQRVHELFYSSLCNFGILGLGSKENLMFTKSEGKYEPLDSQWKIYRKIGKF